MTQSDQRSDRTFAGPSSSDVFWMRRALELAETAAKNGEVPVGAVLLRAGRVLAVGANAPIEACDPTAHAEVVALRAAALAVGNYRLPDTTLYVTVEPCPMCAGALIHARVARIVYGAHDERWGADGSVFDILRAGRLNHQPEVTSGVLGREAAALLQNFFRARR